MKIRRITLTILLTVLATLNLAGSCSTTNNYPPPQGGYPPPGGWQPGGYPGGGADPRILITEGQGRLLWDSYDIGELFVYYARENRLIFNGPVRRGDRVEVEPGNDRILINNQIVYRQNMDRNGVHAIYFDRQHYGGPGPVPGPGRGPGPGPNYPWYRDGVVVSAGDDRVGWNCDQSGQVYVYDVGEDKLRWNGPISRGQRIEVLPGQNKITIDDRTVYDQDLRRNARHEIVLVRVPGGNRGGRGGEVAPVIADPIPDGARRMVDGTGDIAIGEAPAEGRVFVYDDTDRKMLYDTQIGKNNSFQIFPTRNYVNLNSKKHADVRFINGHRHSLYFRAR